MRIRWLIGASVAFTLLIAACGNGASSNVAATSTPPASVAASPAPVGAATTEMPKPNPLPAVGPGGNKDFAAVSGADFAANGAAATIHGSAAAGQVVFAQNCVACHGVEGKGGIANSNSDDGTVPTLNPLDPAFNAFAKGNPAIFVSGIDLYIQHGSRPPGSDPVLSMSAWGDQKKLTQQQIADVEAYVMQLNGVTWPGN